VAYSLLEKRAEARPHSAHMHLHSDPSSGLSPLPLQTETPVARARSGYWYVAGAAALWGLWSVPLRSVERYQAMPAASESFVVLLVMFASVLPLSFRGLWPRARPLSSWVLLGCLGVSDALNVLCFFWAMQRTNLAVAVLTHYLAPVFVAVLAPVLLGERMGRRTWGALGLSLLGLSLLLEPWRQAPGSWGGALLGAASAVFYAANTLMAKRLQRFFSSTEILAWHLPPALLLLLVCVPPGGLAIAVAPLAILVVASLVLGALAGLAYLRGLESVQASHAAVLTLIEPLVAVGIGVTVWGEAPGAVGALGGGLILWGASRVLREDRA
jgi:drug/metabolite transporter (DMT)-like permease